MKLIYGTLCAVALSVVVGCGGGGGGSSSGNGGGSGTPAGTVFKTLTPVTIYNYGITGTATIASVPKTIATGQRVMEVDATSTAGASVLISSTDSLSFTSSDTAGFFVRDYVTQNTTSKDISLAAVDFGTGIKPLTVPGKIIAGTFNTSVLTSGPFTYSGGGSIAYSLSVGTLETVTVTAGTYQAYRCTCTVDYGSGYSRTGTYWYSPSVGSYVKATESVTEPGKTEDITLSLESIATP